MEKIRKEEKQYKSPQRKLVKFFEKSRNQWKEKCIDAKKKIKRLSNRIRFLGESKGYLKNQVKKLKREIIRTESERQKIEKDIEELKKRRPMMKIRKQIFQGIPKNSEQFLSVIRTLSVRS